MVRAARWVDVVWLVAFGAASSAWCLTAAGQLGPTFDEPLYVTAGLTSWRTGSNKPLMSAGTMTLPVDVQMLPVFVWERARGAEFNPFVDMDAVLPVARAANLVFWWLLLVYAMRLGRTFGGTWAGRLAVVLVACDPNFLGHAALATTDISIVATMLALIYHHHHGQGRGWGRRVLAPGLCYGLATLAKASGMVFGAQAVVVVGLYHLARTGALTTPAGTSYRGKAAHLWHATYPLRKDLVWIALIGFTLVFAYTGSDWGTEPTFVEWAEKLPGGPLKAVMVPVSHDLRVFPNAGEALMQQVKHNLRGHGTYLFGTWHERAYWAYFPVALTIKTPAATLLLILAALLVRPRDWNTPLGWVALVLLAYSLNCRVQIGIRFMFTLMAVAYIAAAVAVARGWQARTPGAAGWRVLPGWFVAALVSITAAASVWVWPHGLSFVSQLWGGTETGYRHLGDSNYDWGQGLPELKAWHAAHGEGRPLAVWYYGTDPAVFRPPFVCLPLSHAPLTSAEQVRPVTGPGFLAVSVSILHGNSAITPSSRLVTDWLRTKRPVARTRAFFVYDLRDGPGS